VSFATFLFYWTGLAFVSPPLPLGTLIGTAIGMHICDAIMCRVFAVNNGYPRNAWTVIGFVGGVWAVAVLILLPRRQGAPSVKGRLP
jgi:hypothetical protein